MRLHHLGVTAFGPFVETVDVDFDALSDAGLFLLSGATGAGKSSVLDAVCFALYGAIPGDRHQAHRLRSDQAPPALAPRVELEVTLSGRRFRIVRSPAWERPKRRGTGLTREPAKVAVSEWRREEWTPLTGRLDEAGDLLGGLLGMSLDQFCQVALLPQGHFQAFLRADSAQRHQLLSRLFRTSRFERVEAWLRDHRLTLRRESQSHVASISDLISRLSEAASVDVPAEHAELAEPSAGSAASIGTWAAGLTTSADAEMAEAIRATATSTESARLTSAVLEQARELAEAKARVGSAAAARERLIAAAADHEWAIARLEAGRRAQSLRPLARLVADRTRRLGLAEADAREAQTEARGAGVEVEDLAGEIARLAQDLTTLTVLLPAEQRLTELRAELERARAELDGLRGDEELADAEVATLEALRSRLGDEVQAASQALRELPSAEAAALHLRQVAGAHAEASRLEVELARAAVDHSAALDRRLDLRERLLDVRERRIAGMAAELAGVLAVGDDCPVCGSADHPHPALPGSDHPDAAEERSAQRAVDDAQALEHALDLRTREVTAALAAARELASTVHPDDLDQQVAAAERALADALAGAAAHPQAVERLATTERQLLDHQEEGAVRRVRGAELTTTLAHLEAQVRDLGARVEEARGSHPALGPAVEQVERQLAAGQRAHAAAEALHQGGAALDEAQAALTVAALEAGFEDAADALARELTSAELARLDEQTRHYQAELVAAEAVLGEPGARELLEAPPVDLSPLHAAHEAAAGVAEAARAASQAACRRLERITSLVTELDTALDAWAPVREGLELAVAVSAFAEGKAADNRLQMRLSAYVLSHRLSQVVAAANARLAGMSDQRYSLEHVAERGAGESRGGLSLVVRDDWSGESRDPATLSGGETFVVSLALALGLADVVAHEAGGADLATLFVDEGFGSLDAETLDDVLDILDTLRENGRAVGVVSHVAEMRDRIPTQLLVTKARTGSTVRVSR